MWATFALTIIITASWAVKMVAQKRFFIQRTPLDIPIALFLASQIISTIISLDPHTSLWGYYSRFNGGLLSIISYILLYYAFASNLLTLKMVKKLLVLGLLSGAIVALWGLPSHFGYDPTCLLFRGTFDVSCWTVDFQPKLRIFSTLGQPNWLAAFLAILLPISLSFSISYFSKLANLRGKYNVSSIKYYVLQKEFILATCYLLLATLFFLDLLYTKSQSGFLGFIAAFLIMLTPIYKIREAASIKWVSIYYRHPFLRIPFPTSIKIINKNVFSEIIEKKTNKLLLASLFIFLLTVFFVGFPFDKLNAITYPGISSKISKQTATKTSTPAAIPALELNITSSWDIRLVVWKGVFQIWKHNPIFGSGVETFAYSYYQYRPQEHNLTSEWNFLYNKAHNEYLNFLATTGLFGFLSYIGMIFYFLYISFRALLKNGQLSMVNGQWLTLALLAGYVSILVTNVVGFSVVVINIYFFLIPAFALLTLDLIDNEKVLAFPQTNKMGAQKTLAQKAIIIALVVLALYLLLQLFKYWNADKAYYMGYNLDRAQQFEPAYTYLTSAITQRKDEPVFLDEFSINNGVLAASIISANQIKQASEAAKDEPIITALLQSAIQTSDKVTTEHPNNVTFWKSRVRLFYTLSQVYPKYLPFTLEAIKKAQTLAPTDATISYNLGILQGQSGDFSAAVKTLENTVKLRPAYGDAHFGLALFYHQQAVDKTGKVIDEALEQKAIKQIKYILEKIDPNDDQAKAALKIWGAL